MTRTSWHLKALRGGYRCFTKRNGAETITRTNVAPDHARPPEAETGHADEDKGMSGLTLFGLIAVTLMLVFYTVERRSHWFVLAFSVSCVLGSLYGFMQGAWPFGLVEAVWSGIAFHRWWLERRAAR